MAKYTYLPTYLVGPLPITKKLLLTLSLRALFKNFRKKTGKFAALLHPGNKTMLDFTENLMHSQMNLLTVSQINRKWPKIGKNQAVAEKRISTYPSCKG